MTALKFAELTVRAGFPKGVINILPGKGKNTISYLLKHSYSENKYIGSVVGDALTKHPDIRKLGFTGSTEVGKEIMRWYVKLYRLCY